jgi:hypothetical protein
MLSPLAELFIACAREIVKPLAKDRLAATNPHG